MGQDPLCDELFLFSTKYVSFNLLPKLLITTPTLQLDHIVEFFTTLINIDECLPRFKVKRAAHGVVFTPVAIEDDDLEPGVILFCCPDPIDDDHPRDVITKEWVRSYNLPLVFMCALIVLLERHFYGMYLVHNIDGLPQNLRDQHMFDDRVARALVFPIPTWK